MATNTMMAISGGDALKKVFAQLPPKIAAKMGRRALYAGAKPIRDAARAKAPARYGVLKKAIIVRTGQQTVDAGGGRRVRAGDIKVYVTIDPQVKMILGVHRTRGGQWSLRARKMRSKSHLTSARGSGTVNRADHIEDSSAFLQPRRYAHLVEFGTRPHATGRGATLKRTLKKGKSGRMISVPGAQPGRAHPGGKPRAFMRPAFDGHASEAETIIVSKVSELLAEEAASLSRRFVKGGKK